MGQGVKYGLSPTGKLLVFLAAVAGIIIIVSIVSAAINHKPHLYGNCSAYRKVGIQDIQKDDPRYNESLDRDGDGIACETYVSDI